MKLKTVIFLPRYVIENTEESFQDSAIISIGYPDETCYLGGRWNPLDWTRLEFHDIDKPESGMVLFSENMARQIIDFVERIKDTKSLLIVHCNAGVSRSAAVARFVRDAYSVELPEKALGWPQDTFFKNYHVYRTLMNIYFPTLNMR